MNYLYVTGIKALPEADVIDSGDAEAYSSTHLEGKICPQQK